MTTELERLVRHNRHWPVLEMLPDGWSFDKKTGSPLCGYEFATNGKSLLSGKQERALVRAAPAQRQLFSLEVVSSKMETATPDRKAEKRETVITAEAARTVNELARQQFKTRLLNDILTDLMICEIEGWCKVEYLNEIRKLINSIGQQACIDA